MVTAGWWEFEAGTRSISTYVCICDESNWLFPIVELLSLLGWGTRPRPLHVRRQLRPALQQHTPFSDFPRHQERIQPIISLSMSSSLLNYNVLGCYSIRSSAAPIEFIPTEESIVPLLSALHLYFAVCPRHWPSWFLCQGGRLGLPRRALRGKSRQEQDCTVWRRVI